MHNCLRPRSLPIGLGLSTTAQTCILLILRSWLRQPPAETRRLSCSRSTIESSDLNGRRREPFRIYGQQPLSHNLPMLYGSFQPISVSSGRGESGPIISSRRGVWFLKPEPASNVHSSSPIGGFVDHTPHLSLFVLEQNSKLCIASTQR